MLWRFFGVWGDCGRRGAVATVNLDFCTGGRLKNGALAQCASRFDGFVGDVSWLLESHTRLHTVACFLHCAGTGQSQAMPAAGSGRILLPNLARA